MLERILIAFQGFILGMLVFATPAPGSLGEVVSPWVLSAPMVLFLVLGVLLGGLKQNLAAG